MPSDGLQQDLDSINNCIQDIEDLLVFYGFLPINFLLFSLLIFFMLLDFSLLLLLLFWRSLLLTPLLPARVGWIAKICEVIFMVDMFNRWLRKIPIEFEVGEALSRILG
ncbi:unnamed protein product [Urochloa humidicola]